MGEVPSSLSQYKGGVSKEARTTGKKWFRNTHEGGKKLSTRIVWVSLKDFNGEEYLGL